MYKLTIERPECFSQTQAKVLEIFEEEKSTDSILKKLKILRFIQTSFICGNGGSHVWLMSRVNTKDGRAAIYEEVV